MTNLFNWLKFVGVLLISLLASILLSFSSLVNIEQILKLGNDLQYNLIATSATIGGFLFTGISILISAISNKRIERLWDNKYLDNVYRAAFIGILANILTILSALAMVFLTLESNIKTTCMRVEIVCVLCSLIFFAWCVFDLIFILTRMKSVSN
jgi:hypothetical protein